MSRCCVGFRVEEEPHYNLTTAANVRQPLMLLSLNFLYHPPSHLTLIAPQHKQHCNKKKKSALRRRTHLIDLGHATAVGHLKERTKQNKQKNKKAVSNCTVMLVHFHQAGHAGYPPPHQYASHISHSNMPNNMCPLPGNTLHAS